MPQTKTTTSRAVKTAPSKKKQVTSVAAAPDALRLEYVPLSTLLQWEKNPKRHDNGAIYQSIKQHGFKDPPKFEPQLNGGAGGIVEGNGRSHILKEMRSAGETPPRGVLAGESDWLVPVLFGVDAQSERSAEAYGVDHNNLVLSGGDFGNTDFAKLWNADGYAELLADLAQFEALPVSVDGEDVDDLIARLASDDGGGKTGGYDSFEQEQKITKSSPGAPKDERYKEQYAVIVMCDGESHQQEVYERLRDEGYEVKVVST